MRETTPKVHLIASPAIHFDTLKTYVRSVGGDAWVTRVEEAWKDGVPDGEILIEASGRICYRTWDVGLNANVTKVRTDSGEYLLNILKVGHGSVLEHANYTFIFEDVSRVFTHELVRHRAGVAISQESLRYVRLTDIGFRVPPVLTPLKKQIVEIVESLENFQMAAALEFDLDKEGLPFAVKKQVTSALRRLAPLGLSTSMVWTANVRTLRHVISMRTAVGAEEEMRLVFSKVGEIMQEWAPALFSDYKVNADGEWITPYWKV
jgi:thymidylate synthase (FAD)